MHTDFIIYLYMYVLQIHVCVYTNNIYRMSATVVSVLRTLTYFNLLTTP